MGHLRERGHVAERVVAGIGMIPFRKPGASEPYHVMGAHAARLALADAGPGYKAVQQAYEVGMTGIPIINVNNNCSSGSTALFLARQAIEAGSADCVMALGFGRCALARST